MAQKPNFVVGARAKISVDGKTLAFATNVNYTVDVTHVPVEVLGAYEVIAYEPVGYRVSGTLTVVRYSKNATASGVTGTVTDGNSSFAHVGTTAAAAGVPAAFNPAQLLLSSTFDVEVFDRRNGTASLDTAPQSIAKIIDARLERRSGGLNAKGLLEEQFSFNGIIFADDSSTPSRSGPNA